MTDSESPKKAADATINIKCVDQRGRELFFKLKATTPFSKMFDAYSNKTMVNVAALRFLFDGTRVSSSDTPAKLEMEDGDIVDVHMEQVGGGERLLLTYALSRRKDKATEATGTMLSDPASADCVCALLKCAIEQLEFEPAAMLKRWTNKQTIAYAEQWLNPNEWGLHLTGTENTAKSFPPFKVVDEFVCDKGDGIQSQTLAIDPDVVAQWWAEAENRCSRKWVLEGADYRASFLAYLAKQSGKKRSLEDLRQALQRGPVPVDDAERPIVRPKSAPARAAR